MNRLKCPGCGIPTIPDNGIKDLKAEEAMCDRCLAEADKTEGKA